MRAGSFMWLAIPVVLVGCVSYESAYEKGVYDYEPIYCYQTLADVTCYRKPNFRDERRLVNYYGPSPRRYERPKPPKPPRLEAPPAFKHYYRDPEPIPGPPAEPKPPTPSREAPEAAPLADPGEMPLGT